MPHFLPMIRKPHLLVSLHASFTQLYYSFTNLSNLTSSAQAELLVPRTRTVIRQRRAFSVAGQTAWNGLPVALRLTPEAHSALFLSGLRTTLFDRGWAGSAPE